MIRRLSVLLAAVTSFVSCGGGQPNPVAPQAGSIDIFVTNGTTATIMAGPYSLFFLAPGEDILVLHTDTPVTASAPADIYAYDWIARDNRPVPFLAFHLVAPQLPASGTCTAHVTVTRTSATPDGKCGIGVTDTRTF